MADDMARYTHLTDLQAYDDFQDFLRACRTTAVFADELNNKILYVLHLCRFSNPYELREFLKERTRAVITHRFESLINNGLLDLKGRKDHDYPIYKAFWEQQHPQTRGEFPFCIPTDFVDKVMSAMREHGFWIVGQRTAEKAQRRGEAFQRYYAHQIGKEQERQEQKEQAALESIGVCARCERNITKLTPHNFFRNRLLCRQCMQDIQLTGEWKEYSRWS